MAKDYNFGVHMAWERGELAIKTSACKSGSSNKHRNRLLTAGKLRGENCLNCVLRQHSFLTYFRIVSCVITVSPWLLHSFS